MILVVSHYKEDIDWLNNLQGLDACVVSKTNKLASLYTPINKGQEASAYLEFIIKNYDRIAKEDYIIFSHDHRNSWHQSHDMDYVFNHLHIKKLKEDNIKYLNICNNNFINITKTQVISTGNISYVSNNTSPFIILNRIWIPLFQNHLGNIPDALEFSPGAQFIVSSDAILQHDIEFYKRLLNWIYYESDWLNTEYRNVSGRVLEWMFHYIFTQQKEKRINVADYL